MKDMIFHGVKKIALGTFIIFELFALNVPFAMALFIKKPNVGGEVDNTLKKFHISQGALKDAGENFNVSANKGFAPEVRILFAPQDPQPGKKITARAFAQFFTNTTDSLYFTWYLKRAKCVNEQRSLVEINGTVDEGDPGCDYDGNGVYDINDMKIEAARIIAGNGFDIRYEADQSGGDDDDNDGYVAFPGGDNKRSTTDAANPYYYYIHDFNAGTNYEIVDKIDQEDLYPSCAGADQVAVCIKDTVLSCASKQVDKQIDRNRSLDVNTEGGNVEGTQESTTVVTSNINQSENQFNVCSVSGVPECKSLYRQVAQGSRIFGEGGFIRNEGGGKPECEDGATPVCVSKDALTYTVDEKRMRLNNLASLGPWSFNAYGEGRAADPRAEGYVVTPQGKFTEFQCTDKDIEALQSFWPPVGVAATTEDGTALTASDINDDTSNNALETSSSSYVLSDYYSCQAELYGWNGFGVDSSGKDILSSSNIITECNPQTLTADNYQHFHLFPRNADGEQVGSPATPGFGRADEEFYHTDPFDQDTSDNRVNDEATIVGLGQDSFTWIYTPGDQVGVIVEGTSMTVTKHPDSSNMIMFATVNNACDYSGMINNSIAHFTGNYLLRIRGFDVKIPSISFTDDPEVAFNTCLNSSEHAFVSPAQGGAAKKIDVDLGVTPENPVNDPVSSFADGKAHVNMGDVVTISATITNAKYKADRLRYTWSLWRSNDGSADFDPDNWTMIAGKAGDRVADNNGRGVFDFDDAEVTPFVGNGLSDISFRLNLRNDKLFPPDTDVTYLRARVNVEEDFDLLAQELHKYDVSRGRADVIFRITKGSNKMQVYTITNAAQATDATDDRMNTEALPTCVDTPGQLVKCPVVKNQLLKLVLDDDTNGTGRVAKYINYQWKVNNKPFYKPVELKCYANDSGIAESACNYLPITGEPGTEYTVTVTANSVGKNGDAYGDGKAIEVTRKFVVVEPYVSFCDERRISDDQNETGLQKCAGIERKQIATYASDTEVTPVYSDVVFLAPPYSSPTIYASVRPRWIDEQTKINWFMDGIYQDTTDKTFTVDGTNRNPGESTNITAKAIYQPDVSVRQLMRDVWRYTDQQLAPLHFKSPVQIEYTENAKVSQSAPAAFFAALGVNTPETVLFLFRIFLAVGIVVFIVGFLWRFVSGSSSQPRS